MKDLPKESSSKEKTGEAKRHEKWRKKRQSDKSDATKKKNAEKNRGSETLGTGIWNMGELGWMCPTNAAPLTQNQLLRNLSLSHALSHSLFHLCLAKLFTLIFISWCQLKIRWVGRKNSNLKLQSRWSCTLKPIALSHCANMYGGGGISSLTNNSKTLFVCVEQLYSIYKSVIQPQTFVSNVWCTYVLQDVYTSVGWATS